MCLGTDSKSPASAYLAVQARRFRQGDMTLASPGMKWNLQLASRLRVIQIPHAHTHKRIRCIGCLNTSWRCGQRGDLTVYVCFFGVEAACNDVRLGWKAWQDLYRSLKRMWTPYQRDGSSRCQVRRSNQMRGHFGFQPYRVYTMPVCWLLVAVTRVKDKQRRCTNSLNGPAVA